MLFRRVGFRALVRLSLILLLAGCGSMPESVRNLGKGDIDFVMDVHAKALKKQMIELTRKLYVRNPIQLHKNPQATIDSRIKQIFGSKNSVDLPYLVFRELNGVTGIEAILLSFDENFQGDRVFAAVVGLSEMLRRSYNHHQEFFMIDSLDEQSLYNSARNIEVFVWRLYHRKDKNGNPLIYSNDIAEKGGDISFDRLFTKMIMIQDMMAVIVANKSDRVITKVVQGVAQFAFLPVP